MRMRLLCGAALAGLVLVGACAQSMVGTAADEAAIREVGAKYEKGADGQWRLGTALVANADMPPPPAPTPAPEQPKGKGK